MERKLEELVRYIDSEEAKARFRDIYEDETKIALQQERYKEAIDRFQALYGDQDAEVYSAPGRSEVGGNHTDHQNGCVLACSLNLDFIAVVHKTDSDIVEFKSGGYPQLSINLKELNVHDNEMGTTQALVRGVAAGLVHAGYKVGGFQVYITSEVLSGSGMSSSAGLEILIGTLFGGLYNNDAPDPVFLAQVGQYAENVYFGKPCGLMDQMACSVGGLVSIDFKDPASPIVHPVQVDFSRYAHSLCIVDTKGSHADLTPDYAAVPAEMKQIASFYGEEVLRNVKEEDFYRDIPTLRAQYGDRAVLRAIHFYNENRRAIEEADALEAGDFDRFLSLVRESGSSSFRFLQNVFSVHNLKEQGVSLGLAVSEQVLGNRGACRVHGGGFAGTIQAFVPDDLVETYRQTLDHVFGEGACHVLKVRKYGGIRVF